MIIFWLLFSCKRIFFFLNLIYATCFWPTTNRIQPPFPLAFWFACSCVYVYLYVLESWLAQGLNKSSCFLPKTDKQTTTKSNKSNDTTPTTATKNFLSHCISCRCNHEVQTAIHDSIPFTMSGSSSSRFGE